MGGNCERCKGSGLVDGPDGVKIHCPDCKGWGNVEKAKDDKKLTEQFDDIGAMAASGCHLEFQCTCGKKLKTKWEQLRSGDDTYMTVTVERCESEIHVNIPDDYEDEDD